MAKNNKKNKKRADPSTTVELKLPDGLYQEYSMLRKSNPDVIEEVLHLIFHRDVTFGMTAVKISPANKNEKDKDPDDGIFKVCQAP